MGVVGEEDGEEGGSRFCRFGDGLVDIAREGPAGPEELEGDAFWGEGLTISTRRLTPRGDRSR